MFLKAVSESLKTLVDAGNQSSSVKDNTSGGHQDDATISALLKEQAPTPPEHRPTTSSRGISEAEESKSQPDDLIVQIRAGKSEVGRQLLRR